LPVPTSARGVVAALVGIGAIVLGATIGGVSGGGAGAFGGGWQGYALMAGLVLGAAGLLVRSKYRASALGRILPIIGCGAILAVFLVPAGGTIPLIGLVKMLGGGGGLGFQHIWMLVLFVAAALGLIMSLLPSSTSGGTGLFAWILILWVFGGLLAGIVAGIVDGNAAAILKQPGTLYILIDTLAFSALAAYGLATLFGKSLEA